MIIIIIHHFSIGSKNAHYEKVPFLGTLEKRVPQRNYEPRRDTAAGGPWIPPSRGREKTRNLPRLPELTLEGIRLPSGVQLNSALLIGSLTRRWSPGKFQTKIRFGHTESKEDISANSPGSSHSYSNSSRHTATDNRNNTHTPKRKRRTVTQF